MFIKRYLKKNRYRLFVLFLWCVVTVSNYIWLSVEDRSPGWDEAAHLNTSLDFYEYLFQGSDKGFFDCCFKGYPPLLQITTAVFYKLTHVSLTAAYMTNMFFLLILLWSVYDFSKRRFSELTGFWACFILCFYPSFIRFSRDYWLDFAAMCMCGLAVNILDRTNYFESKIRSFFAGVAVVLALFTKNTTAIPLGFVVIYLIYISLRTDRKRIVNISVFTLVILLFFIFYHLRLVENYKMFFLQYFRRSRFHQTSLGSILKNCIKMMYLEHLNLLFFIVMIAAILKLGFNGTLKRNKILLVWLIPTLVIVFTFLRNTYRYTLLILPAFAVISAEFLVSIKTKWIRYGLMFLIVSVSVFQYVLMSWPLLENGVRVGRYVLSKRVVVLGNRSSEKVIPIFPSYVPKPDRNVNALAKILKKFALKRHLKKIRMFLASNGVSFNYYVLEYYLRLNDVPCEIVIPELYAESPAEVPNEFDCILLGPVQRNLIELDQEVIDKYDQIKKEVRSVYGAPDESVDISFGQTVDVYYMKHTESVQ